MAPHEENFQKWNIIFLIYAKLGDDSLGTSPYDPNEDKDTLQYLTALKAEIRNIPLSDNFNMLLIDNEVTVGNGQVISDVTYLSLVQPDPANPVTNFFVSQQTYHAAELIQKGTLLMSVFETIDTTWQADKTLLITWDHGSAFGIFKTTIPVEAEQAAIDSVPEDKYEILRKQVINPNGPLDDTNKAYNLIRNKAFKADAIQQGEAVPGAPPATVANDQEVVDILTNDELALAIKTGFANQYVDVLIMFNCFMQNMHTCYSLRDRVKFLVAPEGIISMPGYDYTVIARAIANSTGTIGPSALAAIAVNTMRAKFANANLADKFEEHAIFAVSLGGYSDTVISKMAEFVAEIRKEIASDILIKANTKLSRQSCYELDLPLNYSMVDLRNWLIMLLTKIDSLGISRIRADFESIYDAIIIAKDVGNNVYTVTSRSSWERNQNIPPKGVTIYFPTSSLKNNDPVVNDFIMQGASFRTGLLDAIDWLTFLNELYA